ncbi:hypothetical protein PC9H_009059 [Pleurotus ostreatus]|uniref:Uncharacterized protein n=2 Tax=Pleurotus ostreatus TaxID=5322 RepID=A0A8H7DQW6_PLEOS|nr:uncharacterized protein PC9H_009059 [Pleurotus ostreatus]KAF7426690.1 hypothetical protein PC9H_009059 [Pleurotus ostreatus]KAJ8694289.1 hypothetical protein PTI98_009214 [Pleurotus ostreatus]
MHKRPVMLVPKSFPFSPPNGTTYQQGDEKQLCKKTPISIRDIHPCLLGSRDPHFLPPTFHLGWAVGEDKLLELLIKEFPAYIQYSEPDGKGVPLWESIFCIVDGIIQDFNIPEELHECLEVADVLRPDGTIHLALCVGDNRIGILRPQPGAIDKIAERFFNGEPPQWHLDPIHWRWKQKLPRVLSPSEAREWAARMNARDAALEKLKDIHISA